MWTGSEWVTFELEGINWKLLGNAGTSSSTNFVGTTDAVSLPFRTNNTERMRIWSDGVITVHTTSAFTTSSFFAYPSSSTYTAIDGYTDGSGDAIWAYNAGSGSGLWGRANNSSAFGLEASNANSSGTGLIATGNNQGGSYLGSGTGIASTGNNGLYSVGKASNGTGVIAVGNNSSAYVVPQGSGGAFTGYHGVFGKGNNSSNGIGVIGVGNDSTTYHYITGGSGGAFSGAQVGVYGYATKTSDGTGVVGVGNRNVNYSILADTGSGGAFSSNVCGVYGYATNTSGGRYGGYFAINNANAYAWVGARFGSTNYKTIGNGTNSTIVKDVNDQNVIMFCPEAPEVLFQDYGIGQLINGKTHITLDPVLSKNIYVDESHPLKVFVTLEGDCNGIYITNKTAEGFDVIELQGGNSNVPFSWQVVATRANEEIVNKDGSTEITNYRKRFPPAPAIPKMREYKSNIGVRTIENKAIEVKDTDKEELKPKEVKQDSKK
jgi:hypothetical protein